MFEHWNVNQARVNNFIRARALQSRSLDRRLDHVPIRSIKIQSPSRFKVGLLAEPHDYETSFSTVFSGHFLSSGNRIEFSELIQARLEHYQAKTFASPH